MTYEVYINRTKKRELSFCYRYYPRNIMWLYVTLLLIIGSVVADHHHAWETGNEYHFLIRSRTLTVLNNLASQFSGILMKGDLTVQAKSSDTLLAVVSKTQYAPVHEVLPEDWDSEITDVEFDELSLSGKPFEIKLERGVIWDVVIDREVPTWEVNLLKSIVSQLQIDIQGENVMANRDTRVPNDDQPFGQFKAMEDSVGGKCEVHYHIEPLPEDVLLKMPELVPLPNLRKDGRHIEIRKTKNYNRCEQRMAYHSGIVGKMNWKPGSNNELLSKLSTSRIVISGSPTRFTIQSSVTTNKISIDSPIHDTYSGAVYSKMNLTLDRIGEISNSIPESKNSASTGNLVYIYNNPFSSQREPRRPSINRKFSAWLSQSRVSNSSSEESRNNDDSSNSSNSTSSEERDYLQPKPKLNEAPENPLLPYFIGYKGKSIQELEENFSLVAARLIASITKKIENFPSDVLEKPLLEIFEQHITLVKLIRTMDVRQISEIERELFQLLPIDKMLTPENQELYKQTAWDVLCDAVAHSGTGPALITIKNWIKSKKLEGKQAARIISQIPKAALTPTAEYVEAFFELTTDEQVKKQRFLNTTAPLSFAELVRYTQSNKSYTYYPVYTFGRTVSKHDNALLDTYISYMATQLREAIQEGDSIRIQTYIIALGNFGHPKILSVFEPYLEGRLPVSKFQRLMIVVSLNRLVENFPRIARSVAYKIYVNVMEAYELRCAAVYIIMKTNPPLNMLQRMAEFTNQDQENHVNSAVKTNIDGLADMKQPELQDLANKASIARKLLNPHIHTESYSGGIFQEIIIASLNMAQTTVVQTIGSDDTVMSKGSYADVYQSYGGFNLPVSKMSYSISNIKELLDMWYQLPWMIENKRRLIIKENIEEIIEKLDIKTNDPEQIEGNIFLDSILTTEFYPFDNYTLEDIGNMLMQHMILISHLKVPQVFKKRNMNYVYYYDATMAVPTESGLPFIYTLTIPKIIRLSGEGYHMMENSSTGPFMDLRAAGNIIISEKIQSRIGFVTPFEHRHYIAGIDTNSQIFLPTGLSIKHQEKKFELKIPSDEYYKYGTGHITLHHSVVPYTARHNILSFESLPSNETRLVNTMEPHKIDFFLGKAIFSVESDHISSEASEKEGMEAFNEIYNVFYTSGAHYRTFDVYFYHTAAQVNVSFDSHTTFDVNSSEATIPEMVDKRPESEERKEQFLKEISKDINSATSYVFDISVFIENTQQVLTFALANSHLDNKLQALVYWNIQSAEDGEVLLEFCTIGYMQSSPNIPLNFEKAIEETPKSDFKAEMRFGSCANGNTIRLKGNWTTSDDAKETAIKSETAEKCRQEIKQGNIWLPNCQRASKLIRQKNHLMMSIDTDSDQFYMVANSIIERIKMLVYKEDEEMLNPENANRNTIDLEVKMSPDNNDIKIFLLTSEMNVTLRPTDILNEKLGLLKKDLEKESEESECVLDKTQVVTFDGKVYPLKLGNCWHVLMITYPKRNPNNPEQILNFSKYLEIIVMVREMDDGSKEMKMTLNDQDIHLKKSNNHLEVMVKDQVANISHRSYRDDTFEIYQLNGMIVIYSPEYEIYAVYDGERILLRPSYKYLNSVRGLCGNYDMRSDNDFIIPKNCILTKPEEFAATYALTQFNCEGPVLQNIQRAKQSTCIPRSYRPSDVISDREAGRSPTKNRRQDN